MLMLITIYESKNVHNEEKRSSVADIKVSFILFSLDEIEPFSRTLQDNWISFLIQNKKWITDRDDLSIHT